MKYALNGRTGRPKLADGIWIACYTEKLAGIGGKAFPEEMKSSWLNHRKYISPRAKPDWQPGAAQKRPGYRTVIARQGATEATWDWWHEETKWLLSRYNQSQRIRNLFRFVYYPPFRIIGKGMESDTGKSVGLDARQQRRQQQNPILLDNGMDIGMPYPWRRVNRFSFNNIIKCKCMEVEDEAL